MAGQFDLGSASGKVRVEYESTGADKLISEMQKLQSSASKTANQWQDAAKGIGLQGGAINRLTKIQEAHTQAVRVSTLFEANLAATRRNSNAGIKEIYKSELNAARARKSVMDITRVLTQQTSQMGKQLSSEGSNAATQFTTGFRKSGVAKASSAAQAVGGAIALGLKTAVLAGLAAAAAAVAAAVAGIAYIVKKGLDRSITLDTATYKMKALGKTSQETAVIMKSALDAVKGTAYGLDQAASVAAAAVAAGIKPGQQLTDYLKLVADTSAITGRSLEDMGMRFNAIQANNVAFTQDLRELGNAGIPIFQELAKQAGVTQAELAKMVEKGEIDSTKFLAAMKSGVGGAALVMGQSFTGSIDNINASLSRIGQAFLKPVFSGAGSWITNLTDQLGKLEEWMSNNQESIIDFWYGFGKGAMGAAKVILEGYKITSDVIIKLVEVVGDSIGWIVRAFAKASDFFGADGMAKSANELADSLHNWGSGMREVRDSGLAKLNNLWETGWRNLDSWRDSAIRSSKANKDLATSLEGLPQGMTNLAAALDQLGIQADTVTKGLEGTTEEFNKLMDDLSKKKVRSDILNQLKEIRRQFEGGGRQVRDFASAIDKMADSTADAGDKAQTLISALQTLGVLPGSDAIDAYNEKFQELTAFSENAIDSLEKVGPALIDASGEIDTSQGKNAQALEKKIVELREAGLAAVMQGADPAEVWENNASAFRLFLRDASITGQMAEDVINKYMLPKDKFIELAGAGGDPKKAIEALWGDDPAKLNTALNLLTTQQDILNQLIGPNGKLTIPAVVDIDRDWGGNSDGGLGSSVPTSNPSNSDIVNGAPKRGVAPPITPGMPPTFAPPGGLALPPGTIAPGTPSELLGDNSRMGQFFADSEAVKKALADRPDLANVLQGLVTQAEQQGGNFAIAFAQGLMSGSEEVKAALLALAQMAPDYLGSSPAKYGPLSGKGWTYYRGQKFSVAFADGISSGQGTVSGATAGIADGATRNLDTAFATWLEDMNELSGFGQAIFDVIQSFSDIALSIMDVATTIAELSGFAFPKNYVKDPKKVQAAADQQARNALLGGANGVGPVSKLPEMFNGAQPIPAATAAKGGDALSIQKAIISQAQAMGFNEEQILAALAVANQETGYGTNPRTNDIQNQNGTAGITGIFQQDMSYRKYGDPRDPNNAIKGFLTEFATRGEGLNAKDPWAQAVAEVQKPANVGAGGYWDRSGAGAGAYLRDLQREQALEVYNSIVGTGSSVPQAPWMPPVKPPMPGSAAGIPITTALKFPAGGSQNTNGAIGFLEQIANEMGLTLTSGKRDNAMTASGKSFHLSGEAGDFAIPGVDVPTENKRKFAEFVRDNFSEYVSELIYSDEAGGVSLNNGKPFDYGADTMADHLNHVHVAIQDEMIAAMEARAPSSVFGGADQTRSPIDILNSIDSNTGALANTQFGLPSVLEEMANQDPLLQQGIGIARGGLQVDDPTATSSLQHIDKLIAQQNALNTPQSKDTSNKLSEIRSGIMGQQGMMEGPDMMGQVSSIASGAVGIAASAFQVFDSVLNAVGGAKDITGTLARGIENTESINKIIDGVQTFFDVVVSVAGLTSDILGLASGVVGTASTGAAAGGDMGATAATAAALGAASSIAGIVASVWSAINATIDLVQEGYKITTKYLGRAALALMGLPNATDVNYLLDTITGQLKIYSSENPDMKTTWNTADRQLGIKQGSRPNATNTFYIYQGPGQDPRDTMDDAMFSIKASGVGAFGYGS